VEEVRRFDDVEYRIITISQFEEVEATTLKYAIEWRKVGGEWNIIVGFDKPPSPGEAEEAIRRELRR